MIEAVLFVGMLIAIFLILREAKQIDQKASMGSAMSSLFEFKKSTHTIDKDSSKRKP